MLEEDFKTNTLVKIKSSRIEFLRDHWFSNLEGIEDFSFTITKREIKQFFNNKDSTIISPCNTYEINYNLEDLEVITPGFFVEVIEEIKSEIK